MEDYVVSTDYAVPSYVAKLELAKPSYTITFHKPQENGLMVTEIGRLDFNGPTMTFAGDLDESAKRFFEYVAQVFAGRLKEEYQRGYEDCLTEESKK